MSDTILIQACNAVLAAHAACDAGDFAHAQKLANRCQALLTPMLRMEAVTLEGIKAKAKVAAAFCDLSSSSAEGRIIASMLIDLGASVPEGFATA